MTISTTSATPTGTSNLIVSATRGGDTRTVSVSLVMTATDVTPPQWTCCTYTASGSSTIMTFTAWDTQSGMASIVPVQIANATVSIPPFTSGTNSVITFTATESGWSSYVKFQLTDVAGNISYIDPIFVDPERKPGKPVEFAVKDVNPSEGIITIQNSSPGLKHVRIEINEGGNNEHKIEVTDLKDGEVRVVNITSYLPSGGSTVTLTPLGKPGGSALFIFADSPMKGSK